jgi:hypothetical protein
LGCCVVFSAQPHVRCSLVPGSAWDDGYTGVEGSGRFLPVNECLALDSATNDEIEYDWTYPDKTGLDKFDPWDEILNLGMKYGANAYDPEKQMLHVVVKGASAVEIVVRPVVQLTLDLAVTLEEFFQRGEAGLTRNIVCVRVRVRVPMAIRWPMANGQWRWPMANGQ